jgi:2-polyprenyl-6-methoxyphenol hydroxylase-like FAD-dependent oxidoreductase
VIIVGGGIAGASLACALSESEFFNPDKGIKKIYLLDHTKLPELKTYKPILDNENSTL